MIGIGSGGGPFSFFGGLIALFTSGVASVIESNKQDLENERWQKERYNIVVQRNRYDGDLPRLLTAYDYKKVEDEIAKAYPNMNSFNRHQIALQAIAKKMMEEETDYKYEVQDKYKFLGNIERFCTVECRKEEYEKYYGVKK